MCCQNSESYPAVAASPWSFSGFRPRWREEMKSERRAEWRGADSQSHPGPSAAAAHGSQLPRSVLSRERLLVFRGETGLGGLLRLELLEAVECLGESESSPS